MRTELPEELHTWMASGRTALIDDTHVWYRVEGRGPWLVCFHGFPTSSWDWHRLLPLLTPHYRVLVFDFPGYGLSEKSPTRDYSLLRQMDAVEALLKLLGIQDFDLLAHDMGVSVASELLFRLQESTTNLNLRSLILLNAGIYMDLHQPLPTQRLLRIPFVGEVVARLSSYRVFRHQYPQVYASAGDFDEDHYRQQWALILNNNGRQALAKTAAYMKERIRYEKRWQGPLENCRIPVKLIWGLLDPIAVPAIAQRLCSLNPGVALKVLENAAHYPQLEAADEVAAQLLAASVEVELS